MIGEVYSKIFKGLMKKPVALWGLSILQILVAIFIQAFGILPIITIPIILTLSAGMSIVYLNHCEEKEISSEQLFSGFHNFLHVAGGMLWMLLWTMIWFLIPFAGIFIGIGKAYSYCFVPYILVTRPEISATQALKVSVEETKGKRLSMFGADFLIYSIVFFISAILLLLSLIPYAGQIFVIILVVLCITIILFLPMVTGIMRAQFYCLPQNTAENTTVSKEKTCTECGYAVSESNLFCSNCGHKFSDT